MYQSISQAVLLASILYNCTFEGWHSPRRCLLPVFEKEFTENVRCRPDFLSRCRRKNFHNYGVRDKFKNKKRAEYVARIARPTICLHDAIIKHLSLIFSHSANALSSLFLRVF